MDEKDDAVAEPQGREPQVREPRVREPQVREPRLGARWEAALAAG